MKKILLPFSLMISCIILLTGTLCAQSDKEIIKEAENDIKDKNYELAFEKIVTLSQPEKKKAQDILKEVYPNLIADYLSKATAIKINDKDSLMVKYEKLQQVVGYLNEGLFTDSILKKLADADMYKSVSKKKKIESSLKSSKSKLKTIQDIIAKQESVKRASDSIRQDSIRQTLKVDSISNNNVNTQQISNSNDNSQQTNTTTISPSTSNSGGNKFYIIAGSYTTEEAAQSAVNNLKSLGYASEVVGQNAYGGLRISYSSFATKEEALKELERIKGSVQADAWILEK